ncbi:crotonase/enoyl-CoA hydratase family protein [Siculibacillus lacustris]|uniref:Crotonase/enoyl-CoA hydratase family protein n=1 Tax=Siculibacillus lacustris TaxID=1549641 RepID=A0A4Q9VYT2_9HYPH|nr:crotonase/enoyl-CoA hydratase family protein [Siculibacillus lacustris]TBW40671.1 crotonase/enoyl-CoA hydratase family protein [Siculibacillus lacustris]
MSAELRTERDGHVLILTIDDPKTRNALNGDAFFAAIEDTLARANADLDVRCIVVTGAGGAFSSGGNIRDMHEHKGMFGGPAATLIERYRTGIQRIPRAFSALDVPAIAAVDGPAIGAGCDLACMCDIRVASDRAVFAESFVRVGIVAGDGGSWLLPRIVGYSHAAEMAFTGAPVDAAKALAIGLVSEVVPPEKLMATALATAARIAANPPQVLRWTKRLLKEAQHQRLETILDMAAAHQAIAHGTADHAEAVAAMLEKRPPVFEGR